MKLRKAEIWAIAVTALFLAAAIGFHIGSRHSAPEFRVSTVESTPASSAADAETVPADSLRKAPDVSATPAVREGASLPERVDLNTATAEELRSLSGVGEVLAGRIIAYRSEHGRFRSVEDITLVAGVGNRILEANRDRLTVGP